MSVSVSGRINLIQSQNYSQCNLVILPFFYLIFLVIFQLNSPKYHLSIEMKSYHLEPKLNLNHCNLPSSSPIYKTREEFEQLRSNNKLKRRNARHTHGYRIRLHNFERRILSEFHAATYQPFFISVAQSANCRPSMAAVIIIIAP